MVPPMTALLEATVCAVAAAPALLLLLALSPLSSRTPARAPASAAFCAWFRATAITPRSIARAVKPISVKAQTAMSGRITPRRVVRCFWIITTTCVTLVGSAKTVNLHLVHERHAAHDIGCRGIAPKRLPRRLAAARLGEHHDPRAEREE